MAKIHLDLIQNADREDLERALMHVFDALDNMAISAQGGALQRSETTPMHLQADRFVYNLEQIFRKILMNALGGSYEAHGNEEG